MCFFCTQGRAIFTPGIISLFFQPSSYFSESELDTSFSVKSPGIECQRISDKVQLLNNSKIHVLHEIFVSPHRFRVVAPRFYTGLISVCCDGDRVVHWRIQRTCAIPFVSFSCGFQQKSCQIRGFYPNIRVGIFRQQLLQGLPTYKFTVSSCGCRISLR